MEGGLNANGAESPAHTLVHVAHRAGALIVAGRRWVEATHARFGKRARLMKTVDAGPPVPSSKVESGHGRPITAGSASRALLTITCLSDGIETSIALARTLIDASWLSWSRPGIVWAWHAATA